jgi:23S rRNA pseudouridine1911/1915/1917 synthase
MEKSQEIPVLYENESLLVINKPAGIMVHSDGRSEEKTLVDVLKEKYPEIDGVGEMVEDLDRSGIVHRLDMDTTGCLIVCKNQKAFKKIKNAFQEKKVRKIYLAIVEGNIKEEIGVIDKPIARAKSDFRKKSIIDMYSKDFRGEEREAITRYKVLKRSPDKKFTLLECYPETGRTHQIRVHLRGIRHPIIGDALYGSREGKDMAPRQMLHARKISFEFADKKIEVEAEIPADMQGVIDKYFNLC